MIRRFRPAWKTGLLSHALVLTGIRRSGKSTLQVQIRRGRRGTSVSINLEDTRLYGLGPQDFATVLSITGRHLSHEVYPFSFQEFLEFTRQEASAASLEDHLLRGGFAGALRAGPGPGGILLRELLRDVVHRDIVTRHSLRSARPLMTLALHLLAHPGQPLSLQALAKGLGLPSVAQTGLAAANSPNPTPDLGRKLENVVLLTLRRTGASAAFAAAPHEWECDFVTENLAIQCCARLTSENRQRELRGLCQAPAFPAAPGAGAAT